MVPDDLKLGGIIMKEFTINEAREAKNMAEKNLADRLYKAFFEGCENCSFTDSLNDSNCAEQAMPIAAIIEESAESARGNCQMQAEMVHLMAELAMLHHSDLECESISVAYTDTRVFMLALARVMLEINYNIDLHIDNMILSKHPFALDRTTYEIRTACRDFLNSREYLDYLKKNNIAFIQDGEHIVIQMLTGSYSTASGYEAGHMLSVDGIWLDSSMKGWDMIIFLMYT